MIVGLLSASERSPLTHFNGRMSAFSSSGSEADGHIFLNRCVQEDQLHIINDKKDPKRLFPRCPTNSFESETKVKKNKKIVQKNFIGLTSSHTNNNASKKDPPSKNQAPVPNIIDLVSFH